MYLLITKHNKCIQRVDHKQHRHRNSPSNSWYQWTNDTNV